MKILKYGCTLFLIFGLIGCGKEDNSQNDNPTNTPNTGIDITTHVLYDELMGEWTIDGKYDPEENAFQTIKINEDGTAIVDDNSYTWIVNEDQTHENRLAIIIMSGVEEVYGVNVREGSTAINFYAEKPVNNTQIGAYKKVSD